MYVHTFPQVDSCEPPCIMYMRLKIMISLSRTQCTFQKSLALFSAHIHLRHPLPHCLHCPHDHHTARGKLIVQRHVSNDIITFSRVLFTMEFYFRSKTQHTTVKYNQQLSRHMSGQSIIGLSVHLHARTEPQRITKLAFH
jgi:hypothetical protein